MEHRGDSKYNKTPTKRILESSSDDEEIKSDDFIEAIIFTKPSPDVITIDDDDSEVTVKSHVSSKEDKEVISHNEETEKKKRRRKKRDANRKKNISPQAIVFLSDSESSEPGPSESPRSIKISTKNPASRRNVWDQPEETSSSLSSPSPYLKNAESIEQDTMVLPSNRTPSSAPASWTPSMREYYMNPAPDATQQSIPSGGSWGVMPMDRGLGMATFPSDRHLRNHRHKRSHFFKPNPCSNCGTTDHDNRSCPHAMCLNCGQRRPYTQEKCASCRASKINSLKCALCRSKQHSTYHCPSALMLNETAETAYKSDDKLSCPHCAAFGHTWETCPIRASNRCTNCLMDGHNSLVCNKRKKLN